MNVPEGPIFMHCTPRLLGEWFRAQGSPLCCKYCAVAWKPLCLCTVSCICICDWLRVWENPQCDTVIYVCVHEAWSRFMPHISDIIYQDSSPSHSLLKKEKKERKKVRTDFPWIKLAVAPILFPLTIAGTSHRPQSVNRKMHWKYFMSFPSHLDFFTQRLYNDGHKLAKIISEFRL